MKRGGLTSQVLGVLAGSAAFLLFARGNTRPGDPGPKMNPTDTVSFSGTIEPLLKSNCTPCHFPGGKVYAKLPFDDPATVGKLGKKLFTRIHDKEQQELITAWLKARPPEKTPVPAREH